MTLSMTDWMSSMLMEGNRIFQKSDGYYYMVTFDGKNEISINETSVEDANSLGFLTVEPPELDPETAKVWRPLLSGFTRELFLTEDAQLVVE